MGKEERKQLLQKAYETSCQNEGCDTVFYKTDMFDIISELPFNDYLIAQDLDEDEIDIRLWFDNDLFLWLTTLPDGFVYPYFLFEIAHNRKLLVTDELPLAEIVEKFSSVLEEYKEQS